MAAILKSSTKIFITIFLAVLALNASRICGTNSSFADTEKSVENSFRAGTWGEDNFRVQAENTLMPDQEAIAEEPDTVIVETPDAGSSGVKTPTDGTVSGETAVTETATVAENALDTAITNATDTSADVTETPPIIEEPAANGPVAEPAAAATTENLEVRPPSN